MIAKARARFSGGVLHLLETLDLVEGQEVVVRIETAAMPPELPEGVALSDSVADKPKRTVEERMQRTMSSAGAWKGKIDGEAMKRTIYEARRLGSREVPDP